MHSTLEFVNLIKRSYSDDVENSEFSMDCDLKGGKSKWKVLKVGRNDANGFYAAVYIKMEADKETNQIVFACRGSNSPADFAVENSNTTWYTLQMYSAILLLRDVHNLLIEKKIDDYEMSFTGHSLGGKLAQQLLYECYENSKGTHVSRDHVKIAVIFNAAPTQNLYYYRPANSIPFEEYPVKHYITENELLNSLYLPGSQHFGEQIVIPKSHPYRDENNKKISENPVTLHNYIKDIYHMEYYLDSDGNFQDHFINQFDSKRDDILYGRDYTDYMFGGAGKDELYGKGGNDQLIGGPGDDLLEGGLGNDLYFFKKGDGNDVIVESDEGETFGVDVIRITGFALDEIKVNFNRKDVFGPTKVKVTISFTSSSDTLTFVHSYGKGNNIEYIHFCDEYQNTIKIINFKKLADYFTMKNKLTNDDDYFSLTYLLEFATKNGQAFEVNDKEAYEASDPIVMDLDGDGLETVGIEKRVFFDHDGDGKSSLTGWVGPDDGLLVRDLNGDGVINNGTELFGEYALMKDGSRSQNGYAALSELDDNGDGSIDKNDAGFAQLKVWKDSNSDGKSTPNELFTLPDLGIAAIHTKYYDIGSGNESNDNILIRESDYIKQDGSSWAMGEYFFELATNRIDPEQFKQIMKRQEEPVFEKKEPPIIHSNQYEVILANQYIITDMVEKITLEESLDEIAYRATIDLVITDDFPAIGPGQEIRISGIAPQGTSLVYLFHPGVIWECSSRNSGQKHLTVTAYDKTIYLNKCEDEYLLPAGQTASQRLKRYAADWKIPLGHVAETGKSLAKGVYRSQTIFSMILNDLKDTVSRDGLMYRARMTPNGLELYEIGSNSPVWMLDMDQNVEEITQKRTLEGAVTQVKVLGKAKEEDKPVPVLAVEKGETEKYGTLQRIIQNSNIETASQAKKAAQKLLTGMQETITVTAIDINTIRAGDKVQIKDLAFIVTSVRHELGMPGSMTLELMHIDAVRRKYFMAD
ncbi:hypothetical protein Elgi_08190 [Paenibacillus elgii]|nr:hypothetical protein Elgi_08190 [Paenibacillus elgii]